MSVGRDRPRHITAAGVITGLLDVQATVGKQIAIGAAGAFAVFVITFLINPAVL
ncbi:MAG: hypothetical protein JWM58_4351 [Rhizobium sp.]|nr:hypothetical protein [Rhizobium sp.]